MTTRIYVAGSSDELDRAARAMDLVRAEGWEVAHDWVAQIRQVGEANPTGRGLLYQRRLWASAAVGAVAYSHAVWLLAPEVGHARGAFVELGVAAALRKPIAVSGPSHACSIFTALGEEFSTDRDAFDALRGWTL